MLECLLREEEEGERERGGINMCEKRGAMWKNEGKHGAHKEDVTLRTTIQRLICSPRQDFTHTKAIV